MAITLNNVSLLGYYDFGNEDIVIGDISLANSIGSNQGAVSHSFTVNNAVTVFPPPFAGTEVDSSKFSISSDSQVSNTSGYRWLEIRTKGTITVDGTINGNSGGYVGGNGGSTGKGPYGGSAGNVGGYLGSRINNDPFDKKTFQDVLSFPNQNFTLEVNRNIVYPGSGGGGGGVSGNNAAGGAGAGGCGGAMIRLIGDSGVVFTANGFVSSRGRSDGGNGGGGSFSAGTRDCGSGCSGTVIRCSGGPDSYWSGSWSRGGNGSGGRGFGSGSAGGAAACCGGFTFGTRCWSSCGCGYWRNDPKCNGYSCNGGGCCCKNANTTTKNPSGGCGTSSNGTGGAGGGCLIRSYGRISFNSANIDLRGHAGASNGGTLKVFHTGNLSDGIRDIVNVNEPDSTLETKIGAFYNELLYSGYCPVSSSFEVDSLTAVATNYKSGEEQFEIVFNEGEAFVPNQLPINHNGFDIYRAINHDNSSGFYANGGSEPPDNDSPFWVKIGTVSYGAGGYLGPQSIANPSHNQTASDSSGRIWVYSDGSDDKQPAWYLRDDFIFEYSFLDTTIYNYLQSQEGYTLAEAKQIVQDILYAKKAIWYRVEPLFELNGASLDITCINGVRPQTTEPTISAFLQANKSTPYEFSPPSIDNRIFLSDQSRDDFYYDRKRISTDNIAIGHDDLEVLLSTPTYWGSFEFNKWDVVWDSVHEPSNIVSFNNSSVDAETPRKVESIVNRDNTYYYPTQEGRIEYRPALKDPSGFKIVSVSAFYNKSCYDLIDSSDSVTFTNKIMVDGNVYIQEREPTPIFSLSAFDDPDSRGSFPTGDNDVNKYVSFNVDNYLKVFSRITSAYSHNANIDFYDESVARSYPISSWYISYDKIDGSFNKFTIASPSMNFADEQRLRPSFAPYDDIVIPSTTYTDPGIYYTTLIVEASGTSTSFDLSAINRLYIQPVPPSSNFVNLFSSNAETVSAFVPIYFKATEQSFEYASVPINKWIWNVYDSFDRQMISDVVEYNYADNILEHNWKWHTHNLEEDNITVDESLNNICLNVETSAYGRSGKVDQTGIDELFLGDSPLKSSDELCKHLYLYEKPPKSDLVVVEAFTYTSAFTDDNPDFEELPAFINNSLYVSGFAPFVQVLFEDNSVPKSYPISAYEWNFDDFFNDETNIDRRELPLNSQSTGWNLVFPTDHGPDNEDNYPEWKTTLTRHQSEHIFVLPGLYNVTLSVEASSTMTSRTTSMIVEVIEVPPSCDYQLSVDLETWYKPDSSNIALSGESPLTVYFTSTGVQAGSFPIGRLIWDFGDGTEPLVIDRYVDNYNNQEFGSDPRGYNDGIISHVYERRFLAQNSNFTASLSVISDQSNTLVSCSSIDIGPILLPTLDEDFHLVKNRSLEESNENLYVFQRESDRSTYNILLSSD